MKNLRILFLFAMLLMSPQLMAQYDKAPFRKNLILVTAGPFSYGGFYERRVISTGKGGFYARTGVGNVSFPDYYGNLYQLMGGYLFGTGAHHLEVDLGAGLFVANDRDFREASGVGHLGYRYQKPKGLMMFRAGSGFPEAYYIGLGVAF